MPKPFFGVLDQLVVLQRGKDACPTKENAGWTYEALNGRVDGSRAVLHSRESTVPNDEFFQYRKSFKNTGESALLEYQV